MSEYKFGEIEKNWQQYWRDNHIYKVEDDTSKPKFYVLDMFPYPSGAGLHVGHPLGYIASDIYARYKRLNGFNVLHPMGYDSFGLPAEQYAIQTGQHPAITTEQNINRYREQMDMLGFSFDWSREVKTSEPNFYKWTQWIFIKLYHSWYNTENNRSESIETLVEKFKKGIIPIPPSGFPYSSNASWDSLSENVQQEILMQYRNAYLSESYVNWCPALGTVLANDEVKDGVSERGGHPVERKLMMQWSMRITSYADRLLQGLDKIDWPEPLKETQRNWIGKSSGSSVGFRLTPPSPAERGTESSPSEKKYNKVPDGVATADKRIWEKLKEFSRENRKNQTEGEKRLWEELRNSNLGFKFRRQHAIQKFIADFVCLSKGLVVEVDGEIHNDQKEYDEYRTQFLREYNFEVIRFTNDEVLSNTLEVKKAISAKLSSLPNRIVGSTSEEENLSPLERGRGEVVREAIEVFTTRPDTIFGVTFVTLAPENSLVDKITTPEYKTQVEEYITYAKSRSERERQADVKKITGQFTGAYVEHPFTGEDIPVWIGDYVLAGYGTGAVMGVPAHDSRDYAFAKHFGLPRKQVVKPTTDWDFEKESYDEKVGTSINSDFLNGLEVKEAIIKAIEKIEEENIGKGKTNFRLRDAIFGRQRYWGEPIPIYYKDGIPYTMDEKDLPKQLPEVDKYLPTEDGEPPLARANDWSYNGFPLETTTMPGWAGSSWYMFRYMDPHNTGEFASKKALDYWKDVDVYIGGSEHGTGHLLYVRFWTKFLYDMGFLPVDEPAKKLINQGMIQGRSSFIYELKITQTNLPDINTHVFLSDDVVNNYLNSKLSFEELKNGILLSYNDSYGEIINPDNSLLIQLTEDSIAFDKKRVAIEFVDNDILNYKNWNKSIYISDFDEAIYRFVKNEEGEIVTSSEVEKMSKSKWNVVTPDDIVAQYGADTLRLYEMFLGPLEQSKPWNTQGIEGVHRFLRKLWSLYYNRDGNNIVTNDEPNAAELKVLHKTIKKATEDIENFSFNTSVSAFMICVNELLELDCHKKNVLEQLLVIVSPYAPHICEELWSKINPGTSIIKAEWPKFNPEYLVENTFHYPISVNGKLRLTLELALDLELADVEKAVMQHEVVQKWIEGKQPKKIVFVKGKIVNVVV